MNTISAKIKQFFSKNRNNILFVVLFVGLLYIDNVFAADTQAKSTTEWFNEIINAGQVIFSIGSVIRGMLTQLISLFLQPSWTNGSVIGLDVYLKNLWIMVSNIVYFIFAFMLIAIAFKNIVGQGKDSYEMKTALPHLIVGILIVPFSWFIVQFILSISALLTVSSLSLPWDTFKDSMKDNTFITDSVIPKVCTIDMDKLMSGGKDENKSDNGSKTDSTSPTTKTAEDMGFSCGKETQSINDMMGKGDSIFSIMTVYSYGIMKIQKFDTLYASQLKNITKVPRMAVNILFNVLFLLRFVILLIALGMAMFTRGMMLWIFTIFSPLFGLLYFFNGKIPKSLEGLSKLSFKEFLGLAMVPVYVALALSFGLLFTFVATQGLSSGIQSSGGNTIDKDKMTIAGSTLEIKGSFLSADSGENGGSITKSILTGGASGISQLFIDLIALAILWMAVIAALKSSTLTASVVQPIERFGKSIGGTAMKLPQYAPIFPGGMSATGMASMGSNVQSTISSHFQEKGSLKGKQFTDTLGFKTSKENEKYNDLTNKSITLSNPEEKANFLKELISIKNLKDTDINDKQKIIDALKSKKDSLGLNNDDIKELTSNLDNNEFAKKYGKIYKKSTTKDDMDDQNEVLNYSANKSLSEKETKSSNSSLPAGITKDDKKSDTNNVVFNITNNGVTHPINVKTDGTTNSTDTINALKGTEFGKKYTIEEFEKNIIDPMGIKGQTKHEIITGLNKNGFFKDGEK